ALNILTAAPNPAHFIVHRTRFAGFAPDRGGSAPRSWLSLIRHRFAMPPSPEGRLQRKEGHFMAVRNKTTK
ncbi:MAG: hypothetical protein IJ306_03160, partial [Oscillospiraceae bacterium]|nr:hypothetical protein [Oscillospiraceae bacterium]